MSFQPRVVVVDKAGVPSFEFYDPVIEGCEWDIQGSASLDFSIASDSDANYGAILSKEVQVWLTDSGFPDWWGPIVNKKWEDGRWTFHCEGVRWYFGQRVVGGPQNQNLLTNGGFEAGYPGSIIPNWTRGDATAAFDVQRAVQTPVYPVMEGSWSANLNCTVSTDPNCFIYQDIAVLPGYVYTASAWYILDPANYRGPALFQRGLRVEIRKGALGSSGAADLLGKAGEPIDDPNPPGLHGWAHTRCEFWIPPTATFVRIQLFAPNASIWWDDVRLVRRDGASFANEDLGNLAWWLVGHAQDAGKQGAYADLNVTRGGAQVTGRVGFREWWYHEHDNILDELNELMELWGGMEWAITTPSRTQRQLNCWARKGVDRRNVVLSESGTIIGRPRYAEDGSQTKTAWIITGQGNTYDRWEGYASDEAALGVLLTGVASSESHDKVGLNQQALGSLALTKLPTRVIEVDVADAMLGWGVAGKLEPGDRCVLDLPSIGVAGTYRVMRATWKSVGVITLSLNPSAP